MAFPTPTQMEQLSSLVVEHGKITKGKWYTFKSIMLSLERLRGSAASSAMETGAKGLVGLSGVSTGGATTLSTGLTVSAGGASVPVAVTFIPFAAVLAPWIAAADTVRQAGDIFALHDLVAHARRKHDTKGLTYSCKCRKCGDYIQYAVDKRENRVGRRAVHVFTFGATALLYAPYSIYKSLQSGRPKEMNCKGLVDAARSGCTVAIAAIFIIAGNWSSVRGGNEGVMRRATAILTSQDGWEVLKGEL